VIKFKKLIFIFLILIFCSQSGYGVMRDFLYATVGKKAITYSDIVNEIKIILILNNQSFSEEKRQQLEATAIKSAIQRSIKQIEIEKYGYLKFSNADLRKELEVLASRINMSLENFEEIFNSNNIDYSIVKKRIETELLWNSLIFKLYKNNLTIDENEINEQLSLAKTKKNVDEYLLSEIIFDLINKDNIELETKKIKEKIKSEGFEKVAMNLSIAETAERGGSLGWVSENVMAKKIKSIIVATPTGEISSPVLLPNGILIFKVNDKRSKKAEIDIEKIKNQLVNNEKNKLLNMYSKSHYDKLRRSISIDYHTKK
jgi:peptidyl-prolyl cis-trans isomerase SurA